jgi:phage shock protein PspC (stress-responsive transcriptional regulator)
MNTPYEIQIGGITFYIEPKDFETLKNYLYSLQQAFQRIDENSYDILEDLENRIAEIFLLRLVPPKYTIDAQDIELMILQVGTPQEIALAEGIELNTYQSRKQTWDSIRDKGNLDRTANKELSAESRSTRFYLNNREKKIGGVASGLAHYLGIDPVWTRLGFVGSFFISAGISSLAYLAFWIAAPKSNQLGDFDCKRLKRSATDNKIAGVAAGISKYLGIDVTLIRLVLLAGILLKGAALPLYLILWLIMPKVKNLSEQTALEQEPLLKADKKPSRFTLWLEKRNASE